MAKFLTIIGARPQLVKFDNKLKTVLVYTGQHYSKELKDVFFRGLHIRKPDYDLAKTEPGKMIDALIRVVRKEKPDYIIVYGDTRSTMAGAVVAMHENVKLIHIEAGCRSYNQNMIEERIRKFVDNIATIHLAPSQKCVDNLELEDAGRSFIYNVGATQIDSMYLHAFPTKKPKDAYKYYVATIHRESNQNKENLTKILEAFAKADKKVRLYCHPRTQKNINKFKITVPKNVKIYKPIPYKKMINEVAFADKVITDSGGLQVEAFFLKRPCITLRNETEWVETVEQGWNKLVGVDTERIASAINAPSVRGKGEWDVYGSGEANKRIRSILLNL